MILLPFHPAILTAVAVFLINMLILHGHRHQIINGTLYPRAFPRNRLDGTAFDVVQGVSSLQARVIRNTFDQDNIATCKVDSSPVKPYMSFEHFLPWKLVAMFPYFWFVRDSVDNLDLMKTL